MSANQKHYFVPDPSYWPIVGSVGLFLTVFGSASWLHHLWYGPIIFGVGISVLIIMMIGWFGAVIRENELGLYNDQVDRSFRWGMIWFIFSEICFFAIFFTALFYTRLYTVPSLGGEFSHHFLTHILLWPDFQAAWPLFKNPDNFKFVGADSSIEAWSLPALNTLVLLMSGVTVTWAHWALKEVKRNQLIIGLVFTILLGILFLYLQAHEYGEAYRDLNLTLNSGIYGATFFMLTGFHGIHVTVGTIMLLVILGRSMAGHFTPQNHFAFEAVAWYWHFVDVVWLFLFIFVYWL